MQFYHISTNGNLEKMFYPRVPKNNFTKSGFEDNQTPRICVAPSVSECLTALWMVRDDAKEELTSQNIPTEYFVYVPTGDYRIIKPTLKQVPESKFTNEHWIITRTKFELDSKIVVDIDKKK